MHRTSEDLKLLRKKYARRLASRAVHRGRRYREHRSLYESRMFRWNGDPVKFITEKGTYIKPKNIIHFYMIHQKNGCYLGMKLPTVKHIQKVVCVGICCRKCENKDGYDAKTVLEDYLYNVFYSIREHYNLIHYKDEVKTIKEASTKSAKEFFSAFAMADAISA